MSILDLPMPSWAHTIPDDDDLPLFVQPAPHADPALAGLSPETVELLAAGREAIEAWDAAVAAQRAWEAQLAYVPDWAQPMRGAR